MTGSVPGMPRQTGQTRVFGSSGSPCRGRCRAAAEHLRLGPQLGVDLDADDRLVARACDSRRSSSGCAGHGWGRRAVLLDCAARTRAPGVRCSGYPLATPLEYCCVKIGEWDNLGRARAVLQRQLGELGAAEYAAHVTLNQEQRAHAHLRGDRHRAARVHLRARRRRPRGRVDAARASCTDGPACKGLRLQNEAQIDDDSGEVKCGLAHGGRGPEAGAGGGLRAAWTITPIGPMLAFARACIQHAG